MCMATRGGGLGVGGEVGGEGGAPERITPTQVSVHILCLFLSGHIQGNLAGRKVMLGWGPLLWGQVLGFGAQVIAC